MLNILEISTVQPIKSLKTFPSTELSSQLNISLEPNDTRHLACLCGEFDSHLRQIEKYMNITIATRGNLFNLEGTSEKIQKAQNLLINLYEDICEGLALTPESLHLYLQEANIDSLSKVKEKIESNSLSVIRTKRSSIKPRGKNQQNYVKAIREYDINFGIGPAGTGKTYLAVACAVEALISDKVRRIILVRPAVEAGEKLGFLPGDLNQKIDPYLRPLYDALYEMLGIETVNKYIDRNIIEVAPLAFMRGRTLNHSFIILDEAQNTTKEQMKMFLTRIGFGSTAVITGDVTQIDLPKGVQSGLTHVMNVLSDIEAIGSVWFANRDVVRHPLVKKIVEAYELFDKKEKVLDKKLR